MDPDQKNLVLSNYDVNEINDLPNIDEKIKHIVSYLEDVNALLLKHDAAIRSLVASHEISTDRLNSQSDHLNAHDQHLSSHGQHLATHDEHLKLLTNK